MVRDCGLVLLVFNEIDGLRQVWSQLPLDDFAITVGETDATFSFNFKVENIKILPGTYTVVVSQKLLSRFTNKNQDLVYYIALEPDSTFG